MRAQSFSPGWWETQFDPATRIRRAAFFVNPAACTAECELLATGLQILLWSDPTPRPKTWSASMRWLAPAEKGDWWDKPPITSPLALPDASSRAKREPTAQELCQRAASADPNLANALQCSKEIHVGLLFDGTNNNMMRDRPRRGHSNGVSLFGSCARWLQLLLLALVPALAAALAACKPAEPEQLGGSITSYNHTGDYIHQFYVDGQWGGNSRAYGGGGKFVCCAHYPAKWHPGLTATVKWTTSSSDPQATGDAAEGKWHEKVVPIEPYTEQGGVNVHFLPGGEVRLVISGMAAGHPQYPGPSSPKAPADWPPWKNRAATHTPPPPPAPVQ